MGVILLVGLILVRKRLVITSIALAHLRQALLVIELQLVLQVMERMLSALAQLTLR